MHPRLIVAATSLLLLLGGALTLDADELHIGGIFPFFESDGMLDEAVAGAMRMVSLLLKLD
jgi:hypothetical protein